MGILLMLVGGLWAVLGVMNVVSVANGPAASNLTAFALIFNMALFILPGLVVAGLGKVLYNRSAQKAE